MATFIQGVTDQVPMIQPFQPNLQLIQQSLSMLQSKYDQGFASVKNAYNQVLNAPITNDKLKMRRDEYVKAAEQQLKNLSSVDLSLYENQAAAEQVFSPFWEDKKILADTYHTKNIQQQMQRGYSVRDSSDEKVREQYNDITMRYLEDGLQELRDIDPDSPDFDKIQTRRWVPFKNLEKYLNEQAKEQKLEIKWEAANGPYLVEMTNGERSIKSFKTWSSNMIGNNFAEQFQVMGTVERDQRIRNIMEQKPGISRQQAIEMLADSTLQSIGKGYDKRLEAYNDELAEVNTKLEWYKGIKGELSEQQEARVLELRQRIDAINDAVIEENKEKMKYTKNYDQTKNDFLLSPVNYFATLNRQRVVDGWSTAYATGTQSKKVTFNEAIKEANAASHWQQEFDLEVKKHELEWWKARNPPKTRGKGGGSGSSSSGDGSGESDDGTDGGGDEAGGGASSGQYLGYGTTDVTKSGAAFDVFRNKLDNKWLTAHENFFDPGGMGIVLEKNITIDGQPMTRADTSHFLDLLNKFTTGQSLSALGKDRAFFEKVQAKLKEKSGVDIKGPYTTRDAMIALTGDYLKTKRSAMQLDKDDINIIMSYGNGIAALEEFNFLERQRKEAVQRHAQADYDKYKTILKKKDDGTFDFFTVDDVAKDFQPVEVSGPNGEKKKLSAKEFAAAYLSGDFNAYGRKITIGDKVYTMKAAEHYEDPDPLNSFNAVARAMADPVGVNLKAIEEKYGTSRNHRDLRKKFGNEMVQDLPEFQSQTGKMGSEILYSFSKRKTEDGKPEFGILLMNEASNADNRLNIYTRKPGGTLELSKDTDLNADIIKLMQLGDQTAEKYFSGVKLTTLGGPNGNPLLQLIFDLTKENDKTEVSQNSLNKIAKKDVVIELNPKGSGEHLSRIRFGSDYYVHDRMLRGEPMKSDAVLEAAGFHYEITPNNRTNPTYAYVKVQRTVFDAAKGVDVQLPPMEEKFYFNRSNPDEIKATIDRLWQQHLQDYQTAQYQYTQKQANNPNRRRTAQEVLDDYDKTKVR